MPVVDRSNITVYKHLDLLCIFNKITHFLSDSFDSKIQ